MSMEKFRRSSSTARPVSLGTMTMCKNKIKVRSTVAQNNRNSDVMLNVNANIPFYQQRNKALLATPYTLSVTVREVNQQTDNILTENIKEQYMLTDKFSCKLLSREKLLEADRSMEFYISISVTYKQLLVEEPTDEIGFVTIL